LGERVKPSYFTNDSMWSGAEHHGSHLFNQCVSHAKHQQHQPFLLF